MHLKLNQISALFFVLMATHDSPELSVVLTFDHSAYHTR